MSGELIERLRAMVSANGKSIVCKGRTTSALGADINEAADEIARLRSDHKDTRETLEACRTSLAATAEACAAHTLTIIRLRAELSALRETDAAVIARLVGASIKLDKAIDDFLADLRERASWDKLNVDEDGIVTLPCGAGVLYRLGEARGEVGNALATAAQRQSVSPRPRRNASPSEVKTGRQGIGEE